MKKSLFAIAAVTAFAGAAQAQSSVTVYGILDVGYTGGNGRVTTPAGTVKETVNRISNSMESGSRLGFRGNEDLGGGTSAQFVFELGINPAGDNMTNTWTPNIRQGFVGLTQKGMGVLRVGTQNSLFWEQAGSNTTGQLAQTAGSMLAPTIVGANFLTATSNASLNAAYTVRTPNTINVRTERMSGLVAKASYTMSNSNTTQVNVAAPNSGYTGGTTNNSGYQLALDYVFKKANVQASYASFTSENPYNYTPAQLRAGGIGATTGAPSVPAGFGPTGGTNIKDAQTLVTASYDFGVLKAFAGWTDRKETSVVNGNAYLKRTAQEIGVRSFVTPKIEGWGSVGNGRYTAFGANEPTANITGWQLGSNYWMSKRTNLYAIFGANQTSSTSVGSSGVNQYSLGARHTF
jgi:predicted porin